MSGVASAAEVADTLQQLASRLAADGNPKFKTPHHNKERQVHHSLLFPELHNVIFLPSADTMATDNTAAAATISLPEQLAACSKVHWMPFGIAFDGPASTSAQFFEPQQQQTDGPSTSSSSGASHWEAYFRGRQLKGVTKALPDGFQGLVLKPAGNSASNSTSDTQQRSWQAVGGFFELVLWGHDAAPAATDPHMRCIDWLVLADKVHQPVTAEQVEAELKAMQDQGVAS